MVLNKSEHFFYLQMKMYIPNALGKAVLHVTWLDLDSNQFKAFFNQIKIGYGQFKLPIAIFRINEALESGENDETLHLPHFSFQGELDLQNWVRVYNSLWS